MAWVQFIATAAVLVAAALQLARYGDVIGVRTGLGGLFVGSLLIAAVTSLPEFLVLYSALTSGLGDLAIGNVLGSNMFNILILAFLDLAHHRRRILRKAAMRHSLTGALAVLMIALVVFFIYADLPYVLELGPLTVGLDSLVLIVTYLAGMNQVRKQSRSLLPVDKSLADEDSLPSLRTSLLWFFGAAAVLVVITPYMVDAAGQIAEQTGLGTTFIGATLVAIVTSVPELVTTGAAARMGADDMAIGNLFGSNAFNMVMLGVTDVLLLRVHLLATISESLLLVGMLGLLMTILGWFGNLAQLERRIGLLEADALALVVVYFAGMALLYSRGIAP